MVIALARRMSLIRQACLPVRSLRCALFALSVMAACNRAQPPDDEAPPAAEVSDQAGSSYHRTGEVYVRDPQYTGTTKEQPGSTPGTYDTYNLLPILSAGEHGSSVTASILAAPRSGCYLMRFAIFYRVSGSDWKLLSRKLYESTTIDLTAGKITGKVQLDVTGYLNSCWGAYFSPEDVSDSTADEILAGLSTAATTPEFGIFAIPYYRTPAADGLYPYVLDARCSELTCSGGGADSR
jgi:hypothetical protein